MDLAAKFKALVDRGLIQPTPDAPKVEPYAPVRSGRTKTVYNVGDAIASAENQTNAKLDSSFRRNTKDKF